MATLFGTNDSEQLVGSGAADTIFGAGGDDILIGSSGNDHIYGDSGNDVLIGGAGLDFLYGGEGDDVFNATGEGNDSLFGGMGNDIYNFVGPGDNVVEGPNQGIDTVRSSVSYTLGDNVESLILAGLGISGTGNSLNNEITDNSGNNTLSGLGGNDTLRGGGGNDILTGGTGSDQFVFDAFPLAGVATITDFAIASNDKIVLDKTLFSALETFPGNPLLAEDLTVINVAAAVEFIAAGSSFNEIVYNRLTGKLFYNADNTEVGFGAGGGWFATIVGSPDNLSTTNFRVVA